MTARLDLATARAGFQRSNAGVRRVRLIVGEVATSRTADFQVCCVAWLPACEPSESPAFSELATPRRFGNRRYRRLGSLRYGARRPHPHLTETMQLPDRRRPGGSRRWQSVRSILTRALGSPFSDSLELATVLASPHVNGVSRRDGGATTASFRLKRRGAEKRREKIRYLH